MAYNDVCITAQDMSWPPAALGTDYIDQQSAMGTTTTIMVNKM